MEWIYFSIIKPHSSPAHIERTDRASTKVILEQSDAVVTNGAIRIDWEMY